MMRKPYTIKDILENTTVIIDLFDIESITSVTSYYDPETGEEVELEDECCHIFMNNDKEYLTKLSIAEVLYFSKQMWKSKMKDSVRQIFKEI